MRSAAAGRSSTTTEPSRSDRARRERYHERSRVRRPAFGRSQDRARSADVECDGAAIFPRGDLQAARVDRRRLYARHPPTRLSPKTRGSANGASAMPTPLLDRMLVDEPWPDRDGARVLAAVAAGVPDRKGFEAVGVGALDSILLLAPRRMRRVPELACGFAAAARRSVLSREDVRGALDLAGGDRRLPPSGLRDGQLAPAEPLSRSTSSSPPAAHGIVLPVVHVDAALDTTASIRRLNAVDRLGRARAEPLSADRARSWLVRSGPVPVPAGSVAARHGRPSRRRPRGRGTIGRRPVHGRDALRTPRGVAVHVTSPPAARGHLRNGLHGGAQLLVPRVRRPAALRLEQS